jgi:hypothetical protein
MPAAVKWPLARPISCTQLHISISESTAALLQGPALTESAALHAAVHHSFCLALPDAAFTQPPPQQRCSTAQLAAYSQLDNREEGLCAPIESPSQPPLMPSPLPAPRHTVHLVPPPPTPTPHQQSSLPASSHYIAGGVRLRHRHSVRAAGATPGLAAPQPSH